MRPRGAGPVSDRGRPQRANRSRAVQERLAQLESEQQALTAEITKLAGDAFSKEEEALQAAKRAGDAFAKSQRAADTWLNAARTAQRERDPNRKNERLAIVTRDVYLEHVGRSAEAAARLLAGRIYAQLGHHDPAADRRPCAASPTCSRPAFQLRPDRVPGPGRRRPRDRHRDRGRRGRAVQQHRGEAQFAAHRVGPLGALAATYHVRAQLGPDEAGTYLARPARRPRRPSRSVSCSPTPRPSSAFATTWRP